MVLQPLMWAGSAYTDAVGNDNIAANQFTWTYDSTSPLMTITAAEVNDGETTNHATLSLTFTSSESTTDFGVEDVTMTNGNLSNFSGSGAAYMATFTPTADGSASIDVAANAFTDSAGNNNSAASQFTWTYDGTAPVMTITAAEVNNGSTTNDATVTLTYTSSESTPDFDTTDITVTNGTLSNFTALSGTSYTATLTPDASGDVTIDVAAGVFTDAASNGNTAAVSFSLTYDRDTDGDGVGDVADGVATIFSWDDGTNTSTYNTQLSWSSRVDTNKTQQDLIGLHIGTGVISISNNGFKFGGNLDNSQLSTLVVPPNITSIPTFAFYYWEQLHAIILPPTTTSIGAEAFSQSRRLKYLIIPDGISLAGWSFAYSQSSHSGDEQLYVYNTSEGKFYEGDINEIIHKGAPTYSISSTAVTTEAIIARTGIIIEDLNRAGYVDSDGDGVGDNADNAPTVSNADQLDTDSDGVGDVADNAPTVSNADQLDTDSDGVGDVVDNAPTVANTDQLDTDNDGVGDVVDNAPTGLALSANSVAENQAIGTVVGTFTTTDSDTGDSHTYTLVSGSDDTGNGSFSITGSSLKTAASFNYETQSSQMIRVKTDDGNGGTFEQAFTITVTDVNDAPVAVAQSGLITDEDTALAIQLAGTDADTDSLSFTVVVQPANGTLSGTEPNLTYTPSANYYGPDSFTFKVNDTTVDSGAATVSITVNDITAPGSPTLTGTSLTNSATPTLTGTAEEGSTVKVYDADRSWVQVGLDIDGEAINDSSGDSVSMSSDGTTVAIGAYGNDGNGNYAGHVRVYHFNGSSWEQRGLDIDGEAASDMSGYSVSMSNDGTTVAIGSRGGDGNGSSAGLVRIYQFENDSWLQVGDDIDGEAADDSSGMSVSMSSDGNTVAIGARYNDDNGSNAGHVRVYQLNGNSWVQVGLDIDGEASNDSSGDSVSMSSDGTTVAIGAYGNDGNGSGSGHVRIYQFNNGLWVKVGLDIDGEAAGDYSGDSVSMSSDGTTVAIGAYGNDGNGNYAGHVRIYTFNGSSWNQVGDDIDGEAVGDKSGQSVSMSSDGTTVAIGAGYNAGNGSNAGHVRIYKFDSSSWVKVGDDIDGEAVGDLSGSSVSMSSDGTTVAIGAYGNDGNGSFAGHVRIYQLNPPTLIGQATADVTGSYSITVSTLTEASHSITATATDAAGNESAASTTLTLVVDTTAPVISSSTTGMDPIENSGSGQTVYTIIASDAVGVVSNAIGGTDASLLSADSASGVVSLDANPDYETKSSYSFTVTASDAAGNASAATTVTFSITNVDEVAPTITSGATGTSLAENSGGGQTVYTFPQLLMTAEPFQVMQSEERTRHCCRSIPQRVL